MSLSNCVKYEKNIHPMSLIKIEFLAYFRQKRLLSLDAKKAPDSNFTGDTVLSVKRMTLCFAKDNG